MVTSEMVHGMYTRIGSVCNAACVLYEARPHNRVRAATARRRGELLPSVGGSGREFQNRPEAASARHERGRAIASVAAGLRIG